MPKTYAHLMGPLLDPVLDVRVAENKTQFVKSWRWRKGVLGPLLCKKSKKRMWKGDVRRTPEGRDWETPRRENGKEADEQTTLALRNLMANEVAALGWEWDDGNAVHALPALLQTQHMFP